CGRARLGTPPAPRRRHLPQRMKPSSLKNLGPTTDAYLAEVGIETAEEVRRLGAPMVYRILKHRHGAEVNRIWLYALEGALTDRHWNSFSPSEKAALTEAASGDLDVR
ncbi:MAG: TfoX/Sxy family protein, partial [Bacteroidota bacterium]